MRAAIISDRVTSKPLGVGESPFKPKPGTSNLTATVIFPAFAILSISVPLANCGEF